MNIIKKLLASLTALVMAVGFMMGGSLPVMAEGESPAPTKGTITITPPTGTQDNTSTTYRIYKVFDATVSGGNISYKLMSGKSDVPSDFSYGTDYSGAKFVKDDAGNIYLGTVSDTATSGTGEISITVNSSTKYLTPQTSDLNQNQINAIRSYVGVDAVGGTSAAAPTTSVTATGTADAVANNLDFGYYYITTTTGSLVTVTSTSPTANVSDKNSVPSVSKKITYAGSAGSITSDGKSAIAEVGQNIKYQVTVTFGKGSKNVVFHDKMGNGLAKITNSNVTVNIYKQDNTTAESNYTATVLRGDQALGTGENKDDLSVQFSDGIPEKYYAVITYTARVESNALSSTPAKNKAWVTYGESDAKTPEDHTDVYNAKFTVTKHNQNGAPLTGAGFVLKSASNTYYKYTAATESEGAKVEWVSDIDQATEYTSDSNGAVTAFAGLPSGQYTLVEKTVPQGYNKAPDYTFTVNAATIATDSYKADKTEGADQVPDSLQTVNLEQTATIENRAGSVLPSTGGIGTTIFYIAGGVIIIAAIGMIMVRRNKNA